MFNLKEKNMHHKCIYLKGHLPAHRRGEGHAQRLVCDQYISHGQGFLASHFTDPLFPSHIITSHSSMVGSSPQ